MATIDHIEHKRLDRPPGKIRARKAAHAGCNHARHHYEVEHPRVKIHVKRVHEMFDNPSFLAAVFGRNYENYPAMPSPALPCRA